MSNIGTTDPGMNAARGLSEYTVVHKFGRNLSLTTSFLPVAIGGLYPTPQVAGATTVRIKAGGNANDTAAGTGAQKVLIQGLDETGAEVSEELVTAGASASAASENTYIRLYRAYVSESGTYASAAAGSHSASITIENSAGSADWAIIDATDFPLAQTEIAAYTVPLNKTAYVSGLDITLDTSKSVDVIFFQRVGLLETAAPYHGMRVIEYYHGVSTDLSDHPVSPYGPYVGGTDIGFMAKGATSPAVSVNFEIWLVDA